MRDDEIRTAYVRELFAPEDALLQEIRDEARRQDMPDIHVQPEEGRMLHFLVAAIGAKKVVEVGTLAGYSGVWIARALPADGKLYTLEAKPLHAQVARAAFEKAGLDGRVEVREGDAHASLAALSGEGPFDAMFIDAEKQGYPAYLDWGLANVRPGGLIMAHNAFWEDRLFNPEYDDNDGAIGLRAFNQSLADDVRLVSTIVPVGDGIAVAAVRE